MKHARTPAVRLLLTIIIVAGIALTVGAAIRQGRRRAEFTVFPLKYAAPGEARRMLRELLGTDAKDARIIADEEGKRLLVQGSNEAVELAADLVKRIDVVPTRPVIRQKTVRTYMVNDPAGAAQQIRERFGRAVSVAVSESTNTIMVRATDALQKQVAALADSDQTTRSPGFNERPLPPIERTVRAPLNRSRQSAPVTRDVDFRFKDATAIESAATRLFGARLKQRRDGSYEFRTSDGRLADLRFVVDRRATEIRHFCRITGPRSLAVQFESLLGRLDRMRRDEEHSTRFIRVRNVDPRTMKRTIEALRRVPSKPRLDSIDMRPVGQTGELTRAVIQLASYQDAAPSQQAPDLTQNAPQDQRLRRPASDLEIESLPDLDVIMLRGRDPDIEELTRIIREIERIAETTAPEIEVYYLNHVRGPAIDTLIEQVLDDLTGTLQGRVTITPLVKPNALLLIGWGEAVNAVKKLIEKLDRPVRAATQLRIFALRFAPASQVSATIEQFLSDRGGLGPVAIITPDARTNSLIVNASPRDMQEVEILVRKLDVGTSESVNRGRMIRLKSSLATDIAATVQAALTAARGGTTNGRSAVLELMLDGPDGQRVLKSGLLDDVRVTADARTNTLFLSGPAESVKLVEELIARLDKSPTAAAQLKVFPIENGDAGEMVLVLRTLFPAAPTGSTVPQLAASAGESSLIPVRFSVDARTNTVIVTGSSGDLDVVEALIRRLDHKGAQERINRIYRLKNSPAIDVAQAVNEFLRSERIVQQAAPGRLNAFQQIESEVVVVPEPVGNSLIISATPRFYEEIVELVESLDEQPPQVLIQVVLAEVELDNLHEFGVELGLQDSLLFDRGLLGDLLTTTASTATSTPAGVVTETAEIIQAASLSPGFDFNNNPLGNSGSDKSIATAARTAGQALSHFSLGRVNSDLNYGGLVLSASSENVSLLIRALNQSGRFEVLSRPQIMTLDNQPASILVGQRVPRVVASSINQIGQVNSIELEDVGLILGVTPRISPDGMVVMEVDAEKSEIGRIDEGIPVSVSTEGAVVRSPRVNVTRAQTTVSAASGQTIVIGGLITNADRSISRSVPWLSEIPLLGELFKYNSFDNMRKELLIILTPRVIRNRAEAEHIKQLEMARISWSSSDAFDWTCNEATPHVSGAVDDSGVRVIYPDATPGLEWSPDGARQTVPPAKHSIPADPQFTPMSHERPESKPATGTKPKRRVWPFGRRAGK